MKPNQQSKLRLFAILVAALALVTSFQCTASILVAQDAGAAKETLESQTAESNGIQDSLVLLLDQLDSSSFKEREAATEKLIELGPEILRPLSVHFFNSSSEAGWRIHRILEGLGRNGEEEDFLKSIAIIQLLYGKQDIASQNRATKLQYQWKASRRAEAARKLKKLGFKFSAESGISPEDEVMERARIEAMIRAAAIRDLRGVEIPSAPNPGDFEKDSATPAPTAKWKNPREDRQQSIFEIEKIISNSAAENRSILESLLPSTLQVKLPPGTLEIPAKWEANEETLKLIGDLSTLSNLTFRSQKIDKALQQFISTQKLLIGLGLVDCEFEEGGKNLALPASITNLQFEGTLPPIESFESLNQLTSLQLKKVKLDSDMALAISRCRVQAITLEEVESNRKSIRQLVEARGLFRVTMSLCKFELEWLEDIRLKTPSLFIAAPKSFLGVRGLTEVTSLGVAGCQISDVVPDTAAAKAGMQSMDIVTAMDGTTISRFEDLRLLISQKRPGESMEVTVQRGDKSIDMTVTLGELD